MKIQLFFLILGGVRFMSEKYMGITKEQDLYFMETIVDKIIINDGYEGIEVLDCNLKLIKKLKIFNNIVIHSSYINGKSNEMLLFCPENGCFVYVDFKSYEVKIIPLESSLQNLLFSKIYLWQDDIIVLDPCNMNFYRVDVDTKCIKMIREEDVMGVYPSFYRFCSYIMLKNIICACPNSYKAIVQENNNEFFVYSLDGSLNRLMVKNLDGISNFICDGKSMAFVYGNYVEVIGNNNEKLITCEQGDVFLKAAYLKNKKLAVLSSNRLKPLQNRILIFSI